MYEHDGGEGKAIGVAKRRQWAATGHERLMTRGEDRWNIVGEVDELSGRSKHGGNGKWVIGLLRRR